MLEKSTSVNRYKVGHVEGNEAPRSKLRGIRRRRLKNRSGGGSRELGSNRGDLGEVLGFPPPVGLLTAPTLDLDTLECSSHRGLRSLLR